MKLKPSQPSMPETAPEAISGLQRVAIENVHPEINGGRFPAKGIVREEFRVSANIHADGRDTLSARVRYRHEKETLWRETAMTLINPGLDLWTASFPLEKLGFYEYTLEAWVPSDKSRKTSCGRALKVFADRERAGFSAWYEMFPRSAGTDPSRSATFRESQARLKDIASMGFDVLYLPPIHPIGRSFRKGPENRVKALPGDPGSPWAIGAAEGGHKSVHPELGTIHDFDEFLSEAARHGLEVALDFALQCSPDHPYVREHPEWFHHRLDGAIQYAENPPKKYQDIYPLDFECANWRSLWDEMKSIVDFWLGHGVRIFRVDNPHTKPYVFWEWLITSVHQDHPDVLFLAEAFTRPSVMRYLAKLGFTQSYTYFTWRNSKAELAEYLTELAQTEMREYLRPNFFVNTPDILHEFLQKGGRPAFQIRLVLAATLSSSYGIYSGFELCENEAQDGTEEYRASEKYQIKPRDWGLAGNIKDLITRVNAIRHDNLALRQFTNLRFLPVDDDHLLCYLKTTQDRSNTLLVAVNLDPFNPHQGMVQVPLEELAIHGGKTFQVQDLLTGVCYPWTERNFIRLDPQILPAHIFRVEGGGTWHHG